MDIDGTNTGQGPQQQQQNSNDIDIEQSFLQQFSCLGTTDHEELVSQLQKVVGNQLNYATARFFLDMNNWNLQAAVGCYFDFNSGQKWPAMRLLADASVGEGESVTPNTNFVQSWRIQNSGEEPWPQNCYLKCTSNLNQQNIPIASLQPGEITILSVVLTSPDTLGSFQTKWRLCTSYGSYFGDIMWSIVQVTESGTLALTQQLSQIQTNANIETSYSNQDNNQQRPPQLPSTNMDDNEMC